MSVAAENVIGGIIVGGKDAYWRVADLLTPEDFTSPVLARIYRICADIANSPGELDIITVGDEAERQGANGFADAMDLARHTHSDANIRRHAEIVKDQAMERRFKVICAAGAQSGDMATTQAGITSLLTAQPAHAVPVAQVLDRMWAGVMARYEAGDELAGLSTGFPLVDEMTGGLQPGRVYGIGARAKMGKTILAMNICANVALAGHPVGVWSLEMSDEELTQRMSCAVAGTPSMLMQRPRMFDNAAEEMAKIGVAMSRIKAAPLRISDRTDVTIEQIEAQARQMHAAGNLSLLCIDYLGLLRMPRLDRHDLAVAHCTRRVKIIAKELKIPVILVFQLNRGSENNGAVRTPRPSDARDSGSIEQDVDAMFLLHRPSYYDKKATPGLRLDLAIQRNGPTGLIHMKDELHLCRFTGGDSEWVDASNGSGGRDDDL